MNYKTADTASKLKLLFCCIIFVNSLQAQSLEALQAELLNNNLSLKSIDYQQQAAQQKAQQVNQLGATTFSVGAFPLPVETRLGAQQFRLSAQQMFPWFGTLKAKASVAQQQANVLHNQQDIQQLALEHALKTAYYQVYELQTKQKIYRDYIRLFEGLEQLSLAKVASGQSNSADVLRVQLQINALNEELELLALESQIPQANIKHLLNRTANDDVRIDDSLSFAIIPYKQEQILAALAQQHPSLQHYNLQQQVAQSKIELNELSAKPRLGLGADYIAVAERTDITPVNNGRDILQLKASVQVPLFKAQYAAKEKEERLNIQALEEQKSFIQSDFQRAISTAFTQYELAQRKWALYQQQKQTTQSAINILMAKYSSESQALDELLQLHKELVNYDLQLLKAIVQSHLAKSDLERFIIQ